MNKKMTVIFASMMIALCLVGVSYALWYKWMYIYGSIGTDDVDVVFTSVTNSDQGLDPKGVVNRVLVYWDKDVGSTDVEASPDGETLYVTLNNVYPCYYNDLEIEYTVIGSVPVIINDYKVKALDFTLASAKGANDGQVWVDWANGIGTQMDPGTPSETQGASLKLHVEQMALQGATYHFVIWIQFVQWNEYPAPGIQDP